MDEKLPNKMVLDPSLGEFTKIPFEIRNAIWLYTLDLNNEECDSCELARAESENPDFNIGKLVGMKQKWLNKPYSSPKIRHERTAILRTSRAIYNEALPIMVSNNNFEFVMPLKTGSRFGVLFRTTSLNWLCRCQRGYAEHKSIDNWSSWDPMVFVRYVEIYCDGPKLLTSSLDYTDTSGDFPRIAESLGTMNLLKSLKLYFVMSGAEPYMTEQEVEETARSAIMPFLGLRFLPTLALEIHFEMRELEWDGVWTTRADWVERVREIIINPKGI